MRERYWVRYRRDVGVDLCRSSWKCEMILVRATQWLLLYETYDGTYCERNKYTTDVCGTKLCHEWKTIKATAAALYLTRRIAGEVCEGELRFRTHRAGLSFHP